MDVADADSQWVVFKGLVSDAEDDWYSGSPSSARRVIAASLSYRRLPFDPQAKLALADLAYCRQKK
jgi:hypothetical protein